jgi:hypothetical protein
VKKIFYFILFLTVLPALVFAWYASQVYYSNFQWLDKEHFLVLRTAEHTGAAGSFSEILIVNIKDGSRLPLTPLIKGFAFSLQGNKLFVHTNRDIVLYDFSKGTQPVPEVIYNLKRHTFDRIEDLQWLSESLLVFNIFSYYHGTDRVIFDCITKQQVAVTHISEEERYDLFDKKREPFSYKNRSVDTAYLIQFSANREYKYALKDLEALKDYHPSIVFEDGYYKVFLGFYDYEGDAKKVLKQLPKQGYSKAFIVSRQAYEITKVYGGSSRELMISRFNIWYKKDTAYHPLFDSAGKIEPICVCQDALLFLRDSSLYTVHLKDFTVIRLTIPLHEEMNYEDYYINPYWDRDSASVIFPHVQGDARSYWQIKADGSGLKQLQQGSIELKRYQNTTHAYSLKELNDMAYSYYEEWDKNKGAEIPFLEVKAPAGIILLINFHFYSGNWNNSVYLKTKTGKQLVLEGISNW